MGIIVTTVIICGGRDFSDRPRFIAAMDELDRIHGIAVVIHGAALGADHEAEIWATGAGKKIRRAPAKWKRDGKAAGPIRNQAMLDIGKPDLVVAFPGGRGTADMIERARRAGVPVIEPLASIPRVHLAQRPCEPDLGDEMFEERHAAPPSLRLICPEDKG